MKIINLDIKKFSPEDIEAVSSELSRGKVLVLPTDTIYGLSAIAGNKKAVEKIYNIKRRTKDKPFVIVMKSFCMVRDYCYLSQRQYLFLKKELAGGRPITIILKARKSLPKYLLGKDNGVAIRIPVRSDFLINVLKKVNKPIVSTSLNVSGKKELGEIKGLEIYFSGKKPDVAVDAGKISGKASKIIDIRNIDDVKVLRR